MERIKRFFNEFFSTTTIHGFKYIVKGKNRSEKIFWAVSVLVSFFMSALLIRQLAIKSKNDPIMMYLDDREILVTEINFPAVSVCTPLKVQYDFPFLMKNMDYFNYTRVHEEISSGRGHLLQLSENHLKYMQIIALTVGEFEDFLLSLNFSISTEDFKKRYIKFPSLWLNFRNGYTYEASFDWLKVYPVTLTMIFFEMGMCHTFNLPVAESLFENISLVQDKQLYKHRRMVPAQLFYRNLYTPPYKTTNFNLGLDVYLAQKFPFSLKGYKYDDIFRYIWPQGVFEGYTLIFHDSYELPSKFSHQFHSLKYYYVDYLINPVMTTIDESMMDLDLEQRNCFLPNEKKLKFFKVYTKANCEHECRAELTIKNCSCAQFFQLQDEFTRICGIQDAKCFRKVDANFKNECNCLEPCESISYDVQLKINNHAVHDDEAATISIKFKGPKFRPLIRKLKTTNVEILSLVGGFLSLFAGFSFISTVELFYLAVIKNEKKSSSKVRPFSYGNETKKPNFFKEFMKNSTIHSFPTIANEETKFGRLIWIVAFSTSLCILTPLIKKAYETYQQNQIGISQSYEPRNVKDIPFPAITIVPGVYQKVETTLVNFSMQEKIEAYKWNLVYSSICYDSGVQEDEKSYEKIKSFEFSQPSELIKSYNDRHLETSKIWFNSSEVKWNSKDFKSEFVEILTRMGTGFTFNMQQADKVLNLNKISPDFGYKVSSQVQNGNGVIIKIKIPYNDEVVNSGCQNEVLSVHPTNEHPIFSQLLDFTYFLFGGEREILITPQVSEADESLKIFGPEIRGCFFDGEMKLKYFKSYTTNNCINECIGEIVFQTCNCTQFFFIRNETMRLCGLYERNCAMKAREETIVNDFCSYCLPPCNEITYEVEASLTRHDWNYYEEGRYYEEATVYIKFKEEEFFPIRRNRVLTFKDFLSNFGGLAGVFTGMSFLSLVEIIYFFTLRLGVNLFRRFRGSS